VIRKLKARKTPGASLIANDIFQKMKIENREEVRGLLEQCRKQNKFPRSWKETELRWIYKKGDPLKIQNYRPISLQKTLYKIFTRIMTERLETLTQKLGLVTELQNGFTPDKSTVTAVMVHNIIMARRLNKGKPFYVAYVDISKAYDTVSHERLWEILQKSGIKGQWLENAKELYKNTFMRSYTPYGKTGKVTVRRGIKQGCPLSPLLFAFYMNPLATALEEVNTRKGREPGLLM